jgi:hypothetical protein
VRTCLKKTKKKKENSTILYLLFYYCSLLSELCLYPHSPLKLPDIKIVLDLSRMAHSCNPSYSGSKIGKITV